MPPMVTVLPSSSTSIAYSFSTVSVVIIAFAASLEPVALNASANVFTEFAIGSMGST